ncbi:hypothetical protein K474DRAFT_1672030 [Panus rudis PR-1116 ss-1]|nr:hypothetical protein K474DRAFT_1672030 [Panus rudis PR-1116 ss-1]
MSFSLNLESHLIAKQPASQSDASLQNAGTSEKVSRAALWQSSTWATRQLQYTTDIGRNRPSNTRFHPVIARHAPRGVLVTVTTVATRANSMCERELEVVVDREGKRFGRPSVCNEKRRVVRDVIVSRVAVTRGVHFRLSLNSPADNLLKSAEDHHAEGLPGSGTVWG